jgi:hypothetical protein
MPAADEEVVFGHGDLTFASPRGADRRGKPLGIPAPTVD